MREEDEEKVKDLKALDIFTAIMLILALAALVFFMYILVDTVKDTESTDVEKESTNGKYESVIEKEIIDNGILDLELNEITNKKYLNNVGLNIIKYELEITCRDGSKIYTYLGSVLQNYKVGYYTKEDMKKYTRADWLNKMNNKAIANTLGLKIKEGE